MTYSFKILRILIFICKSYICLAFLLGCDRNNDIMIMIIIMITIKPNKIEEERTDLCRTSLCLCY